MALNKLIKLLQ